MKINNQNHQAEFINILTVNDYQLFSTQEIKKINYDLIKCKTIKELSSLVLDKSPESLKIVEKLLTITIERSSFKYSNSERLLNSSLNATLLNRIYIITNYLQVKPSLIIKLAKKKNNLSSLLCLVTISLEDLKDLLKLFSTEVSLKLLYQDSLYNVNESLGQNILEDVLHLFRTLKNYGLNWEFPKRISYKELLWHYDRMSEALENLESELTLPTKNLHLENIEVLDCKTVLPKNVKDLVEWSIALSNCVGSYGYYIFDEKCVLLGLSKNNKLQYCVELNPKSFEIIEFEGKKNKIAPQKYQTCLVEKLNNLKVI